MRRCRELQLARLVKANWLWRIAIAAWLLFPRVAEAEISNDEPTALPTWEAKDLPSQQRSWQAGIRLGLTRSELEWMDPSVDESSIEAHTGFSVGAFASVPFGSYFALEPALVYSQKGADYVDKSVGDRIVLNYVDLSVMATARLPLLPRFRLKAFAGPGVNLLTDARFELVRRTYDSNSMTRGLDLTLIGGVGADIGIDGVLATVDVRYELGMLTVDGAILGGFDVRNRSLATNIGVAF